MMDTVFTIFVAILITLGVILFILLIFFIIPLTYVVDINVHDNVLSFSFKFWFFNFLFKIGIGVKPSYKARIMNKIIADSSIKKNESPDETSYEGESVGDTDFISDKSIADVPIEKHAAKELVKRVEEYKSEINEGVPYAERKSVLSFIDSFKKYLPRDIIDALKLILNEWMKYYKNLMPKKVKTDTTFGIDDPYSTGIILAFLSPLYALYGDEIRITPYFDRFTFESDTKLIGKPQIIFILIPVMNLYFNKRFREILAKGKDVKQ